MHLVMDRKTVLITGASGFMGRNIAESFLQRPDEYNVLCLKWKRPITYTVVADVVSGFDLVDEYEVKLLLAGLKPDIIIHAAATTSGSKDIVERPYLHVTDNAAMGSFLFRYAHEYGVKHVIFLSCGVMYPSGDKPRREEDFNYNIEPAYFGVGWTKVYLERMCEFYSRLGRTKFTAIRHSNCFGPHDKYDLERSHMFGATVRKVMDAQNGDVITVWGDGTPARDLIHVSEVVRFIDIILDRQDKPFELVNVGYGKAIRVSEVVSTIIECSGKDLTMEFDVSKPTIPFTLALDTSRAEAYGWSRTLTFWEAVKKTIDWYQNVKS